MNSGVWFRTICSKNGFDITDEQIQLLSRYAELLIEWNQKINLISRKDEENIWSRHLLGSIGFLFHDSFMSGAKILDLGSGGGLPGIPLAMVCNDLQLTLLDSINKKVNAVKDILARLGLSNVRAVAGRAEEINGSEAFHGRFDYVIARAVAPVNDVVRWGKPFLSVRHPHADAPAVTIPRGSIVLLKGGDLSAEIEQARLRLKPSSIVCRPIVVDGVDASSDLYDKKIIIVQP